MTRASEKARQALIGRRDALLRPQRSGRSNSAGHAEVDRNLATLRELEQTELAELAEIDAALSRIDAGRWGLCAGCGHAIGRQRLLAVPEARLCPACQEQEETVD